MDPEIPCFTILLIIIPLITLLLLRLQSKSVNKNTTSKLPPGAWKLPFIGNMHQLARGAPHQVLSDLAKKYGPIMHLKLGEVSTIVVSSPETAKEVMKTHDINFALRPSSIAGNILYYNCTNIGFCPYGQYWRQLRKICTRELLSSKRVQSFNNIREEEVSSLVGWITSNSGSIINLTEKVTYTIYNVISRAAFGMKIEEHETFLSIVQEVLEAAAGFNIADFYPSSKFLLLMSGIKPKLERLHAQVDEILENIIQRHRKSNKKVYKDLVDVLLKSEGEETEIPLSADNMKAVLLDIFDAGGDTSSVTVDWAMSEMLKNPSVLKKAQAEVRQLFNSEGYVNEGNIHKLKYLKAVIKETLRLHPAGPLLLPRECGEPCEINGFEIPIKSKVIVNAWVIARDPRYWEDPECFKPERFLDNSMDYKGTNFEHIPFGTGRRICPGMIFAMAIVELSLAKLLFHFDWKLPNELKNEELDMKETFGVVSRRKYYLCVIPVVCYYPEEGKII